MLGIVQRSTDRLIEENWAFIESNANNLLPENILGCGHYGCVYSTSNPHIVVKISTDPTEFLFLQKAREIGEWPEGIVRYYQIISLPSKYRKRDVFMVWREAAIDVGEVINDLIDSDDEFEQREGQKFADNIDGFYFAANQMRLGLQRYKGSKSLVEIATNYPTIDRKQLIQFKGVDAVTRFVKAWQLATIALSRLYDNEFSYYVAEALEFYLDKGVLLADVHQGNVGRVERDGQEMIVITDPGHAVSLR